LNFQLGDRVSVLDEAIEGTVVKISGSTANIRTADGFELNFSLSELVKEIPLKGMGTVDVTLLREKETSQKPGKTRKISKKERYAPALEVDLHIHQLVPSTRGMDNYDMLSLQLDTAKRQLEFAMQKRFQRVVFIHGVGEGVLRTELEFLFKRYNNIKFYDADYQKYGRGATEVYIFQNLEP